MRVLTIKQTDTHTHTLGLISYPRPLTCRGGGLVRGGGNEMNAKRKVWLCLYFQIVSLLSNCKASQKWKPRCQSQNDSQAFSNRIQSHISTDAPIYLHFFLSTIKGSETAAESEEESDRDCIKAASPASTNQHAKSIQGWQHGRGWWRRWNCWPRKKNQVKSYLCLNSN